VTTLDLVVLYGLAFLIPLAATLVFTPVAAVLARRFGVLDRPDERKAHLEPTPYLGGLALAIGFVAAGALIGDTGMQAFAIAGCALAMFLLGLVDDLRGLGVAVRVGVEVAVALVLWSVHIRAGLFGVPALDLMLTVIWVVVVVNALNLIDNMDGLASGVAAIAAFAFFVLAVSQDDYLVAALAAALAGTTVGFLRHNFPPARIFLGDAGSLLIGFMLAVLGLMVDIDVASPSARLVVQLLILGVPVFDTAFVVVARRRAGRPVLLGGTDHSSHRLSRLGLSGRGVAFAVYTAQLACSTVAIVIVLRPQETWSLLIGWLALGAAFVGVVTLGVLRRRDEASVRSVRDARRSADGLG
jgi:UDP-GlcNAc:undecaprenyl-phosphate GlcNAc-1-phosphate transferase